MPLYTFIMDYDGGNYVFQVRSSSSISATKEWTRSFDTKGVQGIGEVSKLQMISEVESGFKKPIPLGGMLNSWFLSFLLRGKLAMVNLVKTSTE